MFLVQSANPSAQVWPGTGISLVSTANSGVRLSIVSSYSDYLNQELWYISSYASNPDRWREPLTFKPGLPETVTGNEPPICEFDQAYIDKSVLADLDWQAYSAPVTVPVGYAPLTYRANLTPVRVTGPQNRDYSTGNSIDVWLQFRLFGGSLVQVAWFFTGPITWSPRTVGPPSAFFIPSDHPGFAPVPETNIPDSGWTHVGGMRPAPPMPPTPPRS